MASYIIIIISAHVYVHYVHMRLLRWMHCNFVAKKKRLHFLCKIVVAAVIFASLLLMVIVACFSFPNVIVSNCPLVFSLFVTYWISYHCVRLPLARSNVLQTISFLLLFHLISILSFLCFFIWCANFFFYSLLSSKVNGSEKGREKHLEKTTQTTATVR